MIKATIDMEKGDTDIDISGSMHIVFAEAICLIDTIYECIREKNPGKAEVFKECVKEVVNSDLFFDGLDGPEEGDR